MKPDEEDDLLDAIIPHSLFKRKFTSEPKRQMIETPDYGNGRQFMNMPQSGMEQFAGANTEELPGANNQGIPGTTEQLPGTLDQGQLGQGPIGQLGQSEQPGIESQTVTPQEMDALGQQQSADIPLQDPPFQQAPGQQVASAGVITGLPENAKNFNQNSVTETELTGKGYKVTTDTKEKANSLVKDVKDYGLWEYSVDNSAASTDQTAKILQNKIQADDDLFKGKDSASLTVNQVANAQGSKIDTLLDLFNTNKGLNTNLKGLENINQAAKGLEAIDSATKGFTAITTGNKAGMDLLSTGKNLEGSITGGSDTSLASDSGSLEAALGNSEGNNGHEDVSVVTIPNTYSLEDEHGNSLGSSMEGNHKLEKPNSLMLLKALLKNKLQRQAAKMLLKQKALKAALRPSASPTKSLKEQLTMFLHHADAASKAEQGDKDAASSEPKVSKLDMRLLKFIRHMLSKGIGKSQKHKGVSAGQMKLFMAALKEMGNKGMSEDSSEAGEDAKEADKGKEKADHNTQGDRESKENEDEKEKEKAADKEKQVSKEKEAAKEKEAVNEKEAAKEKESLKEKESEKGNEKDVSKSKEKEAYKQAVTDVNKAEDSKTSEKGKDKEGKELKEEEQKALEASKLMKAAKQILAAKKLKAIQALLKHVKPTARSGHGFFMDPEQPLQENEGMTSNSLMKYLEHETALLDQFQEGSQIDDPALQLKQLTNLMMKVASKAQTKDAYVDARRTTVSPTDVAVKGEEGGKAEGGEKSEGGEKTEGDAEGSKTGEGRMKDDENKVGKGKENKTEKESVDSKKEGKENKFDDSKENSSKKEESKKLNKDKDESLKDDSGRTKTKETGKEQYSGKKDEGKDSGTKTADSAKTGKDEPQKSEDMKQTDKAKDFKENEGKNQGDKNDGDNRGVEKENDKIKESKKLPEVDKARNNDKPVEKLSSGDERGDTEGMKFNQETKSDQKQSKDIDGNLKNDGEKTKQMKGLPELSKLRNNKKIVSKVDGNDDRDTSAFNTQKEDGAEREKGKGNRETDAQHVAENDQRKNSEKDKEVGKFDNAKDSETSRGEQDQGKYNKFSGGKQRHTEYDARQNDDKDTTEQYDLYVANKGNNSTTNERFGSISLLKPSEKAKLLPQLPFLNPGSAHLDVLESDASLKQYLMQKGTKAGSVRHNQSAVVDNEQTSNSDSFDDKEKDRLLQLKDVTASIKNEISKRAGKHKKLRSGGKLEERYEETEHENLNESNVPPAGPGGLPSRTFINSHSIKPMSRMQLKKYKQLQAYKKMMSERNRLRPNANFMEGGSLRHIAPLLADRLVDASSVRLAALARLVAMAKTRGKMIDVAASKKTLPGSKLPVAPSLIKTSLDSKPSTEASPITSPMPAVHSKTTTSVISPLMTSSDMTPLMTSAEMTSTKHTSPIMKASIMIPSKTNAVFVPTSKAIKDTASLNADKQSVEETPAKETSGLLSKTTLPEMDNGIDPSDVTRSQLEKPNKPSIKQVMDLLGTQTGQSGSKEGDTAVKESMNIKQEAVGDKRSPVVTQEQTPKSASTSVSDGKLTKKKSSGNIVNENIIDERKETEGAKRSPVVPQEESTKLIQNRISNKELTEKTTDANIVSNFFKKGAQKSHIGETLEALDNIGKPKNVKMSDLDSKPGKESQISAPDDRTNEQMTRKANYIIPPHEKEAGKALIRKADMRSVIRTLKSDADTANFLLRKRSRIPRVRKRNQLKKRTMKHRTSDR